MNYETAMKYLHGTLKFGSRLGLERITQLLHLMGNPQKNLRFIHVAGTNGKGSTTAFISSILIESGYRTGMFTSPYIERFTERIRINNQEISSDELTEIITYVKSKVDLMLESGNEHPTEFEIITAAAIEYFQRMHCDFVVLEVGLGGRYDSTNVIDVPEVAVITTLSLDHTDRLGKTIGEIAYQKAGIIKNDGEVVLYPQTPEAEKVINQVCREKNAHIHKVDFTSMVLKHCSIDEQVFDYKDYSKIKIKLLGDYQLRNAAVAVETCEVLAARGFHISSDNIKNGLFNTRWPGRLEIISRNPFVLIDGAHNKEGGQALNDALEKYFLEKRKIFITGFLRDKDYTGIMDILSGKADTIITVTPENERAIPSGELAEILKEYSKNVIDGISIEKGLRLAVEYSDDDSMICAFGSLYMIGKIRGFFIGDL